LLLNLSIIIYLGIISRISGSHYKYFGLILYPIPYIALLSMNLYMFIIYIWIFMMKKLGHADGFENYERDNFLSGILSPITNKLGIDRTGKLYDALFWALKGGLIAFPFIFLGYYQLSVASALAYPLSYYLGYNYLNKYYFKATVWGEFLGGVFAGIGFLFI